MMRLRTWFLGVCLLCAIALLLATRLPGARDERSGADAGSAAAAGASWARLGARERDLPWSRRLEPPTRRVTGLGGAALASKAKGLTNELVVILKPGATNIDENGASIINLSLGTDSDSTLLREVIESAHAQGILFLGAAGNAPVATATYPAAYAEVVAVTATDDQGNIASYANFGDFVDTATPGSVVVTFNGRQYLITGTSASTALASGAAAAIAEQTGVSMAEVEAAIRKGLTAE